MVSDPLGDFLTRIKNGYMSRKETVTSPFSKARAEVARILAAAGYISKYETSSEDKKKQLTVTLKYTGTRPAIENVVRVSKPGQRIYEKQHKIPYVQTGYGIAIVSTSKGILSDKEARKAKVGGEIICKVW